MLSALEPHVTADAGEEEEEAGSQLAGLGDGRETRPGWRGGGHADVPFAVNLGIEHGP